MRYKTKDGNDYTVGDIGRTVNGVIITDRPIENPNFELIEETAPAAPAPTQPITSASAPAPDSTSQLVQSAPQINQGSTN